MRYKIVRVKWMDASRGAIEWEHSEDTTEWGNKNPAETSSIESVGILVCNTRSSIVLAGHFDGKEFLFCMKILKSTILSTDYLGTIDTLPKT